MNALTVQQERPERQVRIVEDDIPLFDTAKFEHMARIAQSMANSSLLPETLTHTGTHNARSMLPEKTILANAFLVTNQAVRWGMDPFAVAQCASVVHGRLMFEGKLVAAVITQKLGIRLAYNYSGAQGDARTITVSATIPGETKAREVTGTVAQWKTTGNNTPWKPGAFDRQLAYRGAREWARLHSPELMLGIYTDDEIEQPMRSVQSVERSETSRPGRLVMTQALPPPTVVEAQPADPIEHNDDGVIQESSDEAEPQAEAVVEAVAPVEQEADATDPNTIEGFIEAANRLSSQSPKTAARDIAAALTEFMASAAWEQTNQESKNMALSNAADCLRPLGAMQRPDPKAGLAEALIAFWFVENAADLKDFIHAAEASKWFLDLNPVENAALGLCIRGRKVNLSRLSDTGVRR